jgi:DNA-binding transcriptional MerR regulator
MLTITKLARACGLSRTAVLYYERKGLLGKPARSAGNYRRYTERDLTRLREIRRYRDTGLTLADIRTLLAGSGAGAAGVLERRLAAVAADIERLRGHQQSLLQLLTHKSAFRRHKTMTKDKWVAVMRAAGFTDDDMHRWHAEFEKMAPEDHAEFLRFLHIEEPEAAQIRAWSRGKLKA